MKKSMDMKRFLFVAFTAAVLAIVCAACCACRKGKNNKPLTETEWHMVRMMSTDMPAESDRFVLTFAKDGNVNGVGACNRIMGGYTATEKGGMTFGRMASTRMMCPDMELEDEFLKVLNSTTHYEIDGDMLMLLNNGEVQAIFKGEEPAKEGE